MAMKPRSCMPRAYQKETVGTSEAAQRDITNEIAPMICSDNPTAQLVELHAVHPCRQWQRPCMHAVVYMSGESPE
jgi:hypothetical protein